MLCLIHTDKYIPDMLDLPFTENNVVTEDNEDKSIEEISLGEKILREIEKGARIKTSW
jgi:hypothetical protein